MIDFWLTELFSNIDQFLIDFSQNFIKMFQEWIESKKSKNLDCLTHSHSLWKLVIHDELKKLNFLFC